MFSAFMIVWGESLMQSKIFSTLLGMLLLFMASLANAEDTLRYVGIDCLNQLFWIDYLTLLFEVIVLNWFEFVARFHGYKDFKDRMCMKYLISIDASDFDTMAKEFGMIPGNSSPG